MKILFLIAAFAAFAVTGCSGRIDTQELYNRDASVSASDSLAFNPLEWKVVTIVMDKKNNTMSTLYSHDKQWAFVTWNQVADARWFGANIPGRIKSVEFIQVDPNTPNSSPSSYARYQGNPLRLNTDVQETAGRASYIAALKPPIIP